MPKNQNDNNKPIKELTEREIRRRAARQRLKEKKVTWNQTVNVEKIDYRLGKRAGADRAKHHIELPETESFPSRSAAYIRGFREGFQHKKITILANAAFANQPTTTPLDTLEKHTLANASFPPTLPTLELTFTPSQTPLAAFNMHAQIRTSDNAKPLTLEPTRAPTTFYSK